SLRIEGPPYRLSPSELNRVLALSSGGITKTVDRLESAGLVVRGPDPRDGRGVQVELTPSGRKRAARVFDRGLTKYSEKFAHFDRAKLSRVVDSLGAILAAFEDARPSRPSQPESSD
ncbi:MAG: MarR family winged helix-turn-helix transcriptional regulator, partial [Myxococcota bacterium]